MMIDPPKKLSILFILEILKRETNENHPITLREIIHILKHDYDLEMERKGVARNIRDLIAAGYDISTENGYYLASPDFEYSELRLLIDSVLFSKNIPRSQCKSLLKKVAALTDRHFNARIQHIATMPVTPGHNQQIFYTIEVLDEAISQKKKFPSGITNITPIKSCTANGKPATSSAPIKSPPPTDATI